MAGTATLEGIVMCSPLSSAQVKADVTRFLEQATFGPDETLVARVLDVGIPAYLAQQFAAQNGAAGFPVVTSRDGTVLFTTGANTAPLTVPVSGSFTLAGYNGGAAANARLAALTDLLAQDAGSTFVRSANAIGARALRLSGLVNPILANANSTVAPLFSALTSNTAKQLYQVAKMIEACGATGAKRQILFGQLGSFDTHNDQLQRQQVLFAELAPALNALYAATVALGVSSQVTTFTLSDFGRALQPAAGGDTDPASGSHHFILGDAVRGAVSTGRSRSSFSADRTTPKGRTGGFRRRRSTRTGRRSRGGSARAQPRCRPCSRISPGFRRAISAPWPDAARESRAAPAAARAARAFG